MMSNTALTNFVGCPSAPCPVARLLLLSHDCRSTINQSEQSIRILKVNQLQITFAKSRHVRHIPSRTVFHDDLFDCAHAKPFACKSAINQSEQSIRIIMLKVNKLQLARHSA